MGKRRGQTGAGGAVVSSLSENSGGTVKTKKGGRQGGRQQGREDPELAELANPSKGKGKKPLAGASGSSTPQGGSAGLPLPRAAPKWLGKSPQQMLREWCTKNNRIRP